ncbi:snapalysin family zinc-dependent metalloprotease [Streptomyces avicenniae]|uniref:snapalysin family zinc-dependent metalloprotease n=1 Tax=Streptomyces avicenniae TaxID=500153 RepID=UPI00069B3081|nr:snapalysin family zinc-dependent metalloprotease [Streptomyces avicenniae]
MPSRTLTRAVTALAATLALGVSLTGTAGATDTSAAPTGDVAAAAVVLTYDASGSAEFASAVAQGAAVWNTSVANVRLEPVAPGRRANIRIVADNGWPRAQTTSLGNGTVWMGRQAVAEGYHTVRIAAHELGHILGLPDIKPGPCSSLMSGSTGGVSCTNIYPNSQERAWVEDDFSTTLAAVR